MPPKTKRKNAIGRRERRALGIPSPVDVADPVELLPAPAPAVDIGVNAAAAAPADEPNLSESMVMVTPEEQQQQRQPWNSPMGMAEESSRLSPIAAADESMNQTDLDYEAQGSPRLNMMDSSDSSMGSSPTPIFRKILGMKKKIAQKVTSTQFATTTAKVIPKTQLAACANVSKKK